MPELAEGFVSLDAGDHCPRCKEGVLLKIGEREHSRTLYCFMCQTQGSHDPDIGHQLVTASPRETPTGFTLSPAQFAAKDAIDVEEAAAEHRTAEHGSGVTSAAGAEQHG